MVVVRRYSHFGVGFYFGDPIKRFENVEKIINFLGYSYVKFDYYGKTHIYKLFKGKYGLYFTFGCRYYLRSE